MKKTILIIAIAGFIAVTGTAVAQESQDLRNVKTDSSASYLEFKRVSELKVNENEAVIADLKSRKRIETSDARAKYEKKVLVLEERNKAMKQRIAGSDVTETAKWTSFKHEFNRDMEQLWTSIRELDAANPK